MVGGEVVAAGLVGGRVENGQLVPVAVDGLVPGREDEEGAYDVVERVEVVNPGWGSVGHRN